MQVEITRLSFKKKCQRWCTRELNRLNNYKPIRQTSKSSTKSLKTQIKIRDQTIKTKMLFANDIFCQNYAKHKIQIKYKISRTFQHTQP